MTSTTSWLESALLREYVYAQLDEKNKKEKPGSYKHAYRELKDGLVRLDDKPTKHYLKEELAFILQKQGFKVLAAEKIEYTWDTEFTDAPSWLKSPYPWDWMVVAQKIK